MSIENIKFNPYEEYDINKIIGTLEKYLFNSQHDYLFENLVDRIYFDNSVDWNKIIKVLFEKHSLNKFVLEQYNKFINENRNDILPQYTYFITFLVSSNLLSEDIINDELYTNLLDENAKGILIAFLASWNLEKAIEIDNNYITHNFSHLTQAKQAPIRQIILNSNEEDMFNIVQTVIIDSSVQFHFNQEIQKIINQSNPDELERLEHFIEKCIDSRAEYIIEFICDLFELTSIQEFLSNRWNLNLTERIYKKFSKNYNFMTESLRENTLMSLNRLRNRLKSDFALAARQEISRLSDNDKSFIISVVEKKSGEIIDEIRGDLTIIPNTRNWGWKDFANFLVNSYKEKYPNEDKIDMHILGKYFGIQIITHKFETEEFDACIVRDVTLKSPIIFVNTFKKSDGRINYSIAHELGHAVIPHHADSNFFCFVEDISESNRYIMDKELEFEANSFASYLLLPDRQFKEETARLNFTLKDVNFLSRKYGASLVLVAKKWVELSNLEIAMVFSSNGIIDWYRVSENFPFRWIDYIDKDSSVLAVINTAERKILKKKVYSEKWFIKDYPRYVLKEESVKIFNNKVLTLLQIVEDLS